MTGGESSADSAQPMTTVPSAGLVPEGVPGVVGGVVSGPTLSPTAWSTRTSSKFAVHVPEAGLPISSRWIGVVPVLATQLTTIGAPSRYRFHVPDVPTVPQSSSLCHPEPSATPELKVTPETSDLTWRMPELLTSMRAIAPLPAVRQRVSTMEPVRAVTFTRKLTHRFP